MNSLPMVLVLAVLSTGMLHADEVRIPENVPRPLIVGVSVSVNSIARVNDQAGTIEASLDVQLTWRDPDLAFDPVQAGTHRRDFTRDSAAQQLAGTWTPALTLANGTIKSMDRGLFISEDGTVVFIQRVQGVFDVKYRLYAFPFDTQSLAVRIVSEKYDTNEIQLTQDQRDINASGLGEEVRLPGWKPKRLAFVMLRERGLNGRYYPEMQAQIVLSRDPYIPLVSILMPFFLVMFVPTIGMFYTRFDLKDRLGFWGSSILAVIALHFTYTTRYGSLPADSIISQLIVIGSGYQILMIVLTITIMDPKWTDGRFSNKFIVPEIIGYLHWAIPLALIGLVLTRVMLTALSV